MNNQYNRTIYEVIETYPSIIRHEIPLIHLLMSFIYHLSLPFISLYLIIKKGFGAFSNIELTDGAENNKLVSHFDLMTLESVSLSRGDVISTESFYFNKKDSKIKFKELSSKGYSLNENVSGNFIIKKRIETIFSGDNIINDEEKVLISIPRIAISIHNVFSYLKLL